MSWLPLTTTNGVVGPVNGQSLRATPVFRVARYAIAHQYPEILEIVFDCTPLLHTFFSLRAEIVYINENKKKEKKKEERSE